MTMECAREQLEELSATVRRVLDDAQLVANLDRMCALVVACLQQGHKVLTIGNGGSATDALHLAEELIGRYRTNRRPLPAICLAADATALTCIGNDFGFDDIFSRQVEALAEPGDVVIAFSTSGNSANITRALEVAQRRGAATLGMLGKGGGPAAALCTVPYIVPSNNTARIQELHTLALHVICEAVERVLGLDAAK
jgi:D-sedoheptulose 7-phosphate isomerase